MTTGVLIATAALLWLLAYGLAVRFWPFTDCGRCRGTGKRKSPTGRAFRTCPRCRGTKQRARAGLRILVALHILRKGAP